MGGWINGFVMAVPFILPTPLFRRELRRKRFFLLEFYLNFISISDYIRLVNDGFMLSRNVSFCNITLSFWER
jgi:hypothetical protein